MKFSRLSSLILGLAIAVFALGYSPSFADKPDPEHSHGGDDDPATVFEVEMLPTDVVVGKPGLLISNGACGTAEDQGLDVTLPDLCVWVNVNFIPPDGPSFVLRAFGLDLRLNKSDMLIFFTDGQIISGRNTGDVYVSDRLPVTINRSNGSITVEVNLFNKAVKKGHPQGKERLVGPIAIGEIVYTPIE